MNQTTNKSEPNPTRIHDLLSRLAQITACDDPLLDKIGDVEAAVRQCMAVKSCSVWLCEKDEARVAHQLESFRVRRNTGPLGRFIAEGDEFFFTDDYLHDPRINQFSPEAQNFRLTLSRSKGYTPGDTIPQAYVRIAANGRTLGVLLITRRNEQRWQDSDKWWLRHVAAIIGHIIETDRLMQKAKQCGRQEHIHELLLVLVPVVSSRRPFEEKMAEVERTLCETVPLSSARVWLREGGEGVAVTSADGFKVGPGTGPLGEFIFGEGHFFCTGDYFADPRIKADSAEAIHYRAAVEKQPGYEKGKAVPQAYVRIRSGDETLGVLACAPKPGAEFTANDEWWLNHVAGMLALVIENRRLAGRRTEKA
ncbi:MAG: GAF domain-containing protein [Planctomycetota bacterium]